MDNLRAAVHEVTATEGYLTVLWPTNLAMHYQNEYYRTGEEGAPIHRAQMVKDLLAQGASARLQSEPLPGYAPELNPAEGVWRYLQHVELRNVCRDDLPELRGEVRLAVKGLCHKRRVCAAVRPSAAVALLWRLRPTPQAQTAAVTASASDPMPLNWVSYIAQRPVSWDVRGC
jgi:hypothetical protein